MNTAPLGILPPLLVLLRTGGTYQPNWTMPLEYEDGSPEVSLRNARKLFDSGLTYLAFVHGKGGTLIIFETGEMFLACGLYLGGGEGTEALATLADEIGLGDQLEWFQALPRDYEGPIGF